MCFKKEKFDYVSHPECDHHWVHNAGGQCKWSIDGDSNELVYFYICTRCGGEFWSQRKEFDIPYYRVKES